MMMNNAFGYNYFGQPTNPQGFAVQSGLTFNNVTPAKSSSSTPEEMDIIKSKGGSNFEFTASDSAVAGWDYRDGTNLCIELVDAQKDRVRAKWTGEEFNIIMVDEAVVKKLLDMLKDVVSTTKLLNTSLDKDISKQMYVAAGILYKLLPTAYVNGRKNYNNVINQARQQIGVTGYQGSFGQNGMMFAGQFGQAPNYFVNDSSTGPNMPGFMPNYAGQPQYGINPNAIAQANAILQAAQVQQQMGMGMPTQPNGGTMMGGNPFVQGGQPQQVPQMNQPSVPFPGTPQAQPSQTFNPPIGQPANTGANATTAAAPF